MCCSGMCYFENNEGDCVITTSFKEFCEIYDEYPCIVGGMAYDEEDELYIDENKERLDAIYHQWWHDYFYKDVMVL